MLDFLSTTKTSGDDVDDARDIDEARHMQATATAEQHNNFDKPEKVTLNFMSLTSFENYKFIVSSLRCINTKETHYILRFINYYQVFVALKS